MKAEIVHVVQSVTIAALEYVLRKGFYFINEISVFVARKGCIQKKIAEKETLVYSHLTPSLPSLNGTREMGT